MQSIMKFLKLGFKKGFKMVNLEFSTFDLVTAIKGDP